MRQESKQHLGDHIQTFSRAHQHELTALVCYNDEVGLEVANVCSEMGLSIQDDLSIIGQDNSYIVQKNAPVKLTTLTHPQEQMGPDATDWMIKNIQGKKSLPDQTFYEPELIPGETIKQLNARKK